MDQDSKKTFSKSSIKSFAVQARNILRAMAAKEAGFYGVTKDGCASCVRKGADFETYQTLAGTEHTIYGADIRRRASLKKAVEELGFEQVIEETAYTWFNRIIAIRFMEVNDYLPTRVRVLSSENGGLTPDIVTHSLEIGLNLTAEEQEKIQKAKDANKYEEAYRMLFIKQCNELNDILPGLFERTDDYMELLLKISYTGDSVIRLLVDGVAEDSFNVEAEGQVEIIGWMYQYYNSELKDDTFAKLKKNIKITKERIPAATQLFTPDWIVRYMVENSVGRVWIDHLRAADASVIEKEKALEYGWKYYLPEAEQEAEVVNQLVEVRKSYRDIAPQDITCIDPCMGSGHILVYMFDVLMDIYKSEGYSERDAVFSILENNIFGLDIDRRAYQLSYFALMMKGMGYGGRRFFRGKEDENGERIPAAPHVYAIEESNSISRGQFAYYGAGLDELSKNNAVTQMNGFLDVLTDAKEYGSILKVDNYDWRLLRKFVADTDTDGQMTFDSVEAEASRKLVSRLVEIGEVLAGKYDAVVTNPPYMGASGMNGKLSDYVKKHFSDSKSDLFACFIEHGNQMLLNNGYNCMVTMQSWMFLSSFENMRKKILASRTITNLMHMENMVMGIAFGTAVTIFGNMQIKGYKGTYHQMKLVDIVDDMPVSFPVAGNRFAQVNTNNFSKIPGSPVAYWVGDIGIIPFENGIFIKDVAEPKAGLATGDNDIFQRYWYEVLLSKIGFGYEDVQQTENRKHKWFPCHSGGNFRKWYTNNELVVNWENNGAALRSLRNSQGKLAARPQNTQFYFKEGLTWNKLSSSRFAVKYKAVGAIYDDTSRSAFPNNHEELRYIVGYLCSAVAFEYLKALNPTMSFTNGDLERLPYLFRKDKKEEVVNLVTDNIGISKTDWDSFETSWDFKRHPLISVIPKNRMLFDDIDSIDIAECFTCWEYECNDRFNRLKANEEELNRIFIDIYGLQDELTPEVEDKDVTVRKADLGRDIRSLLSYAVGCMFGRYSLAKEGLIFAGGKFDKTRYGDFSADDDAIIPITDESYFEDDMAGRFEEFIRVVFGTKSLEDNLQYIAEALGTKGISARDKIRNYFLNGFYADHVKIYQKRPIYWLFDSGKQNGFKALIYIHRYTPDTVGLVRSVYLKKTSDAIEASLKNAEYIISENAGAVDVAQATKKRDKYVKQLAEIKPYYQALSHVAMQRIPLDLDDGVKVNYAKFQGIEVAEDGGKRQTIDLLGRI